MEAAEHTTRFAKRLTAATNATGAALPHWRPRGLREFRLVIYGASGYTGKLTLAHAVRRLALSKTPFAIAGRSFSKLESAKAEVLGDQPSLDPPVLQVSLDNAAEMYDMCLRSDVVLNVAGPFMHTNADLLVEACIMAGTHYTDVNGEIPFVNMLVNSYHRMARASGVLIVPNAAFAGAAVDLAVYCAAQHARSVTSNTPVRRALVYTTANQASVPSGGTRATRQAMASAMRDVARVMTDPFSLGGKLADGKREEDQDKVLQVQDDMYVPRLKGWLAPNMYAFFETRLPRRSNGLLYEHNRNLTGYGPEFNVQQFALTSTQSQAQQLRRTQMSTAAEEEQLKKEGKLYGQGEGAPKEERKKTHTRYFVEVYTSDEEAPTTKVQLDAGDPYQETGHVAIEVALTLFQDIPGRCSCSCLGGGVLTPAVAGGKRLIQRLNGTGMRISPVDSFDTTLPPVD